MAAELAGQRAGRAAFRHSEAHDDGEVLRIPGFLEDLVQLLEGVDDEVAHAIVEIGRADRFAALDRVHEGEMARREHVAHQA